MPVPSFLFLTGVNGRENTGIKNQSASQELRLQGTPGQASDLCPSYVSLFLSPLLDSCHLFIPFSKVPRSFKMFPTKKLISFIPVLLTLHRTSESPEHLAATQILIQ